MVYSTCTRRFVVCLFLPCVILFMCFSVLLALRLPRFGKRKLILVIFVHLIDLCLFGFDGFLFLLMFGKGCDLWLWHSLDFSLTFILGSLHAPPGLDWLQSFLFYIYFSLSLHYFYIMILFNPTSNYLWLNKNSQGTEVNKNSTSYTGVVSPQKKK